jgi:segregation and condensation protein B
MSDVTLKHIVEGLLMASEQPLSIEDLHKIICSENNLLEINELQQIIKELVDDCNSRGVELKEVASGWRFQVRASLSQWISKLYEERPLRYSRALLETLAIIAYRQPVTRAEIENIRGVTVSSNIMKTLIEHEWVQVVGYKEVPGKPAIFASTKKFLDYFNLKSLNELPPLIEFTETLLPEIKPETETEIALAAEAPLDVNENSLLPEEILATENS